jgi:hypothetical protein
MFDRPPFLISYTALGAPLAWEPPRAKRDDWFPFVHPGVADLRVEHWPDFCSRADAERMLAYCQRLAPNARLIDILHDPLPPGVGQFPNPIVTHQSPPYDVSVYAIVGDAPLPYGPAARLYVMAGGMADFQQGLRSGLQNSYMQETRTIWDMGGQIVSGQGWPWDTAYAYVSPNAADEAQLYWGNFLTGPALGGLAA